MFSYFKFELERLAFQNTVTVTLRFIHETGRFD